MIQQPPFLRPCRQIGPLHVLRQLQSLVERGQYIVVLDTQMLDAFVQPDPLPTDALLLGGEQGFADLIGVVGGEQLALLTLQSSELDLGLGDFLGGQDGRGLDLTADGGSDGLALSLVQFPGGVVLLVCGLDRCDPMGALGAGAVLLAAADEVFVFAAVADGLAVDQAPPALAAEDAAAQVVEVPPRPFPADFLARQKVLDLLEGGLIDQRLMATGVDLPGVADLTDVIGVAQYQLPVLGLERPRRRFTGRP